MKAWLFAILLAFQFYASAQNAQKVFDEAVKDYYNFQYTSAISSFVQTKDYYQSSGDKRRMLKSYYYLIMSSYELDDMDAALDYLLEGSDIAMTTYGEESQEAGDFYIGYGKYYHSIEEYDTAKMFYRSALELIDPVKSPIIVGEIWSNLGYSCDHKGEYDSALIFYKKAADIMEQKLGLYHAYTDWLYASMPYVASKSGNYKEEIVVAKKSLDIKLRLWGANTEDHYLAVKALAVAYEEYGEYQLSMENFKQALTLSEKLYGIKSAEYATSLTELGSAYSRLNLVEEGVRLNQQSYELRKKILGEKDPLTLSVLRNIGNIYYDGGRYQEAMPYYQQSLDLHTKTFGKNAKELIQPLTDLAQVNENTGKIAEAEALYLRALELKKKYSPDQIPQSYIGLARLEDEKNNMKKSLDYLDEALLANLKYNNGDLETEAFIKNNIGTVYRGKDEFKKALEYLNESLAIRIKIHGERSPYITQTLSNIGNVYYEMNELDKAEEKMQLILSINIDYYGPEHPQIANNMTAIANILSAKNKYRDEINFLEKAERIYIKANGENFPSLINIYNNLAIAYQELALYDIALTYVTKQKAVVRVIYGDQSVQMADCENIEGMIKLDFGNTVESKQLFKSAVSKYKAANSGRSLDLATVYNNLGVLHMKLLEYAQAREYYEIALDIYREKVGEKHPDYITTMVNLGMVEDGNYNYNRAIQIYDHSLKLGLECGVDSLTLALIYLAKGNSLISLNAYPGALENYQKAQDIYQAIVGQDSQNMSFGMMSIANVYYKQKHYSESEKLYKQAEKLFLREKTYGNIEGLAKVYLALSDISRVQNKLTEAVAYTKKAREAVMSTNGLISSQVLFFLTQVQMIDNTYLQFLATKNPAYLQEAARYIKESDLLLAQAETQIMSEKDRLDFSIWKSLLTNVSVKNSLALYHQTKDEKYLSEAFYYAERSKSNVLINSMKESRITSISGVDQKLLDRERELRAVIRDTQDELFKTLGSQGESEEYRNLKDLLFKFNREYDEVIIKLRANPRYQKMINTHQLSDVNFLRENQLEENEALVEYAASDSTLHTFVITKRGVKVFSKNYKDQFDLLIVAMRNAITLKSDQSFEAISGKLYDLTFKDVEDYFKSNNLSIKVLTIVPEGPFSYFPFEALKRNGKYLIEDYDMRYSYSASLTSFLNTTSDYVQNNSLLAFAPVFSDPNTNVITQGARDVFAAARSVSAGSDMRGFSVNGQYITPLPGTKQEVEAIDKLIEAKGYHAETLVNEQAREEAIKSGILTKYQYIHFATHGFVSDATPAYSGVFLSQNQNSSEDCILFASEIYGLEIKADLVTLSACETGLGQMAYGEGIVGLTRAFIYAGAKNLLVSQWPVSDESTAKMMVDFYQHLLSGEGKTQSLREAKLALIKDPKFSQPYYWAPFVLIGQ